MVRAARLARDMTFVLGCFLILPWLVFGGVIATAWFVMLARGELPQGPHSQGVVSITVAAALSCAIGPACLWIGWRDRRHGRILRPLVLGLAAMATAFPLGLGILTGGS